MNKENTITVRKPSSGRAAIAKIWPHLVAIAIMYLLTVIYFAPVVLDNRALPQSDTISAQGAWKDAMDYAKAHPGSYSEWTNNLFSGMPTGYGYADPTYDFNIFAKVRNLLHFGLPALSAGILFSYLLGFYIFMICVGANVWMALLGAVAYAFASYNIIIIDVGHVTKAYAMAYIAPLIGGIILTFRKKYGLGFLTTLLFLGVEIYCNHIQITYYAAIMAGCIGLAYLIHYIIKKEFLTFLKSAGILLMAAALAVMPNSGKLVCMYEYSKDTMRGGAELSITPEHRQSSDKPNKGGLEIDYAYAWSYGKMETFTQMIPNLYGGGHTMLDKNSETARELRRAGYGSTYLPTYWGDQPFTSGPVYAGAIVCFLFILGLFTVKGPEKWWIIAACVISFILSWGRNLMPVNEWLFNHLPFYNKFRTPSMALIMAGIAMPMLGMFGLKNIINGSVDRGKAWKYTWISLCISLGLCLLLAIIAKIGFNFTGAGDAGFMQQLSEAGFDQGRIDDIMAILKDYRGSMLYRDIARSAIFILLAFAALWLYLKGYLKKAVWIPALLSVLVLADEWSICKRYLNDEHFQSKKKVEKTIQPTQSDLQILQDKDINYRVLNMASNTFNESMTSYFHKSIGGYSPAKLRRYQDMIDFYIQKDMQNAFSAVVQTQGTLQNVDPDRFKVLNMLNTKYFILPAANGQTLPVQNPYHYGNAWYVDSIRMVADPDEEILAIANTDVKSIAIVDKRYSDRIAGRKFVRDTAATIVNTLCDPNHLVYKTHASTDQVAVFSEVFYDKGGWTAYVDGQETPHFRADYILRSMIVPAGDHTVDFKYVPHTRLLFNKVNRASSIFIIALYAAFAAGAIIANQRKKKPAKA